MRAVERQADEAAAQARLTGLGLAWGVTGIMHHLTFERLGFGSVTGAVYLAATLALVARPSSLRRFGLFLVASVVEMGRNYEYLSNHVVFEFWLIVALLAGAVVHWSASRGTAFSRAVLYTSLAPLIRTAFLLLYLFAFASKLNSGFLDPDASCAAKFTEMLIEDYGLGGLAFVERTLAGGLLQRLAIWLTLALELAIPLLLLSRRTRKTGFAAALVFHFAMGLVPILGISSFSSLAFACLLPWMPDEVFVRWWVRCARVFHWFERRDRGTRHLKAVGALLLVALVAVEYRVFHPGPYFVTVLWLLASLPPLWVAGRACVEARSDPVTGFSTLILPRRRGLLTTLIPLVALGVSPYLGFGTQGTFTMFSNLRLHGEAPNHLIARPGWFFFETPNLVRVFGTNHAVFAPYRDGTLLLTEHEFRRRAATIETDFFVIGLHRGERFIVGRHRGTLDRHPLLAPLSWPARVLLRHRDIPTTEPCECQW